MPLPVIADCFRAAVTWEHTGTQQTAANVMHFLAPGKTAEDVFNAMDASTGLHQFEGMNSGAHATSIEVLPLDGSSVAFVGEPANWVGSSGSADFSPASSILIKLATDFRGRRRRGRIYLPFIVESVISDGFIPQANADEITGSWVDWSNDIIALGVALAVASYRGHDAKQVTNLRCETALGTQRRRQERVRS